MQQMRAKRARSNLEQGEPAASSLPCQVLYKLVDDYRGFQIILNTMQFSLSSVHAMRVIGGSESEPVYGCYKISSHLIL